MGAPANKRSTDEIVAEIIKRVECPPKVAPLVQRIVWRLMTDLRTAPEPFSDNQKENVEFAEKFHNEITKLKDMLKSAPKNPFVLSVIFEERFWQVWWDEQTTPIAINANTKRYITQERTRQNRFTEKLDRLRARCKEIINQKPGQHGGIKHQHRHAALASFVILESVAGHTRTKLQLTCSPTSKFVDVARLFVEAATGEHDVDPRRACEALKADLDAKK